MVVWGPAEVVGGDPPSPFVIVPTQPASVASSPPVVARRVRRRIGCRRVREGVKKAWRWAKQRLERRGVGRTVIPPSSGRTVVDSRGTYPRAEPSRLEGLVPKAKFCARAVFRMIAAVHSGIQIHVIIIEHQKWQLDEAGQSNGET